MVNVFEVYTIYILFCECDVLFNSFQKSVHPKFFILNFNILKIFFSFLRYEKSTCTHETNIL